MLSTRLGSEPGAFLAVDVGTATTAVALVGHLAGRWRLLGATAVPATIEAELAAELLVALVERADPALAAVVGVDDGADRLPVVTVRTFPTPTLAVLGVSERALTNLGLLAERAGWRTWRASMERLDPLGMLRLALDPRVEGILAGAGDPPGADERPGLAELAALVAAVAERGTERPILVAGGLAEEVARQPVLGGRWAAAPKAAADGPPRGKAILAPTGPGPASAPATEGSGADAEAGSGLATRSGSPDGDLTIGEGVVAAAGEASPDGPAEPAAGEAQAAAPEPFAPSGSVAPGGAALAEPVSAPASPPVIVFGPAVSAGHPPGEPLRRLLEGLGTARADGRSALVRGVGSLASVLGRRVELVEVGHDAGLRAMAAPGRGAEGAVEVEAVLVPSAALVPGEVTEELVDEVLAWSSRPVDRARLRDRLAEFRRLPWADLVGDGARLRLAAAQAALARLAKATPELSARPAADLLVVAGGVFAGLPGSVVALAVANILRRPGAWQIAYDHARLLGPLGSIEDEGERRAVLADLVDDLLLPIGSVVMPAGLRAGRSAGLLVVHGPTGATELDLVPGGLELVDLAPGERAPIELRFDRPVFLGTRGRRFVVDIAGGLGGLLVDLRDVPMRLPERAGRRRELLAAWEAALWPGRDLDGDDDRGGRG